MAMAGRASAGGSTAGGVVAVGGQAAAALDALTASLCGLIADVQNKLAEMKANRGALRQDEEWRSRAKRFLRISARAGFDQEDSFSVTRGLDPRVHGSPGQARR